MPTMLLTQDKVDALPPAAKGTDWYYDSRVTGLSLAVGKRKKSFYLSRSLKGKNIRIRLGECPSVKLSKARQDAEDLNRDISRGVDPRPGMADAEEERLARLEAKKEAEKQRAATLRNVLDDYIDTYTHESYARLSLATADQYRRVLDNHCGNWLDRSVHEITPQDIKALHKRLRETPHVANQLVRVLHSMLRHAEIPVPPKFPWFKKGERKMDILDLVEFRKQAMALPNPSRRGVWLLAAFTGIRRQNLLELEWEHVDLKARTLYLSRMKNGLDRTMPLSLQAAAVIRSMRGYDERWVFPSFGSHGTHLVEVRDPSLPYIFHNTRRVFTEACASCLLPRYAISYLRGDKGQNIEEQYITTLDLAEAVDRVGMYLRAKMRDEGSAS